MYITRVEIENIKSIKHLVWEIDADKAAGWHVILGDNGAGKSTFVRSVALALIGLRQYPALRLDLDDWLRADTVAGKITAKVKLDAEFDFEHTSAARTNSTFEFSFAKSKTGSIISGGRMSPDARAGRGWFISSYGPHRRLSGGNEESEIIQRVAPAVARHASVFNDGVALTEGLEWLRQLQFEALEGNSISQILVENIKNFLNQQHLLPGGVEIAEIRSSGVRCFDARGLNVDVLDLGDGYRSVLGMALELLRQLSISYGPALFALKQDASMVVTVPGVVQIDEIDAHLHPSWQMQIGIWLTKHFPNIQFIVTTHSPLVCQAAERGSIFRLPTPGTDETGKVLEGSDRDRLLYGNILDAYSTQAFGFGVTRSKRSEEMLDKLSDLNMKEVMEGLTEEEMKEQDRLRAMLPTSGSVLPAKFAA